MKQEFDFIDEYMRSLLRKLMTAVPKTEMSSFNIVWNHDVTLEAAESFLSLLIRKHRIDLNQYKAFWVELFNQLDVHKQGVGEPPIAKR